MIPVENNSDFAIIKLYIMQSWAGWCKAEMQGGEGWGGLCSDPGAARCLKKDPLYEHIKH